MTCQVGDGLPVGLSDQHRLRKTVEAVFDPGFVQEIAFCPIEVGIIIKSRVAVTTVSNDPQQPNFFLSSETNIRSRSNAKVCGRDRPLEGHAHIGLEESVLVSQVCALSLFGICERKPG